MILILATVRSSLLIPTRISWGNLPELGTASRNYNLGIYPDIPQTHTHSVLAFVSEFYVATPVRATQREQLYTTRATQ